MQRSLYLTRACSVCSPFSGFAIGSIEGRVGIHHLSEQASVANFAFKCHRKEDKDVYSVNAIAWHPRHGTFATVGGDGGERTGGARTDTKRME